jgi:hypothetical protein
MEVRVVWSNQPSERRVHESHPPSASGEVSKHQPYKKLLHLVRVSSFEHEYAVDDFGLSTDLPVLASRERFSYSISQDVFLNG